MLRNRSAWAGALLVLGKPLGIGVYSAALKKGMLGEEGYRPIIGSTTRLNTSGVDLAVLDGVHAVTGVTGFGLSAEIHFDDRPFFPDTLDLARAGHTTGTSTRNRASHGEEVRLSAGPAEVRVA